MIFIIPEQKTQNENNSINKNIKTNIHKHMENMKPVKNTKNKYEQHET